MSIAKARGRTFLSSRDVRFPQRSRYWLTEIPATFSEFEVLVLRWTIIPAGSTGRCNTTWYKSFPERWCSDAETMEVVFGSLRICGDRKFTDKNDSGNTRLQLVG